MAGRAVAKAEAPSVPDLVRTPALDITSEDVALPRIHIAQFMSKAVQDKKVETGTLYYSTGQDDPEPVVLDEPVTFHVLALRKGKSYAEPGGELERYDFDDPDAPAGAWVTYDYTVCLPEVDATIPFKLLLTKTGQPAARNLNTVLARSTVPFWELAFALGIAFRENKKGRFWIPQVRQIEAAKGAADIAKDLAVMLSSEATEVGSGTEQPDI